MPFPTHRLAAIALHALSVDQELSLLVRRSFSLARCPSNVRKPTPSSSRVGNVQGEDQGPGSKSHMQVSPLTGGALHLGPDHSDFLREQESAHAEHCQDTYPTPKGSAGLSKECRQLDMEDEEETVLVTQYSATTNRMLRVSVNGFFESVAVVLNCMKELDLDVVSDKWVGEGEEEVDELRRVQGIHEGGPIGVTPA